MQPGAGTLRGRYRLKEDIFMKTCCLLAMIVALAGCQSGGGTASLNTGYSSGNCYLYDYTNTGANSCLNRTWH